MFDSVTFDVPATSRSLLAFGPVIRPVTLKRPPDSWSVVPFFESSPARVSTPLPVFSIVAVPAVTVTGFENVPTPPVYRSRVAFASVTPVVPCRPAAELMASTPFDTVVGPVKPFDPESARTPRPVFVRPPEPLRPPE